MRILICTFTYPPNRDGVAAACEAMARGLKDLGHAVSIATRPLAARSGQPAMEGGLPVYEFDGESPSPQRRATEDARFVAWIEGASFDVIVCHCWYMWPADTLDRIDGSRRPPVVLVSHGYTTHLVDWSPRLGWGLGAWTRGLSKVWRLPRQLRSYAWVTFLSARPDLRRFLDLWVARRTHFERYSIIPNGTDPARFAVEGAPFREVYGLTEPMLFLCVANYSPRKNQKLAVRAFRRARMANAALVFIGSELGDYGDEVRALDAQLGSSQPLGRVVFLEKVSQQLTASAYAACDAFVLSAKAETQPIVLLEAMAAGKPWVSTDTGCVRELPGGLVVSSKRALAAALQRLATEPDLRTRLGAEGQKASRKKYTWAASVTSYDELLRRLVSATAPASSPTS